MRALWVDAGNDYDPTKGKANGITAVYFDIRDPRLSPAYFHSVEPAKVASVGVYAVASWYPFLSGSEFAQTVSARLEVIAPDCPPDFPCVCLDIETSDVGYVREALSAWRSHRPRRVTDWTLEGHKGGIFTRADAAFLSTKVRYVVPQCYNGAMTQVWDTFAMAADLTTAGFPWSHIRPFYDAAHLPEWWEGYAFTQGRLP